MDRQFPVERGSFRSNGATNPALSPGNFSASFQADGIRGLFRGDVFAL
jgi:hypothetical protein